MLQDHIFKKIIHVSDIHIPSNLHVSGSRRKEYEDVFKILYQELEKWKQDALIVITGDLIHSKIEMQNETQMMARQFLTRLGNICPTVVILGNHDFLEHNRQRTTSLEVICDQLPHVIPLIYSGHYIVGNIHFGFSSLLDNQIVFARDLPPNVLKYGLFHGCISDWFPKFSKGIPLSTFDGYDGVLLGHIHKQQIHMQQNPSLIAAYAGSLMQQNFGEPVDGHGFLIWNLETKQVIPIYIENESARITLQVNGGILTNNQELFRYKHRKLHIRLKCENTNLATYQLFKNTLLHYYPNVQSIQLAQPLHKKVRNNNREETELDYLANHSSFPNEIKQLHTEMKSKIQPDLHKVSEWTITNMEFENIFRYKGHNTVNWDLGLYALSGLNTSGKSSLMLIVLFGLFGKVSRNEGSPNNQILHRGEQSGYIQIEFQQHELHYKIRRDIFVRTPKKIGSQLQFFCQGNDLTGATVNKTQYKIYETIGSFDSFVLLHIVSNRFSNWLQMSPGEKFQHLWQQCHLTCFQEYAQMCSQLCNEISKDMLKNKQSEKKDKDKPTETKEELQRRHHSLISNLCPPSKLLSSHRPPTRSKHELKMHLAGAQQFYGYLMYQHRCSNLFQLQELLKDANTLKNSRVELLQRLHHVTHYIDDYLRNDLIEFLQNGAPDYKRDFDALMKMQQHQQGMEEELHGIYLQEVKEIEYCKIGLTWYKQHETSESYDSSSKPLSSNNLQDEYIACMQPDQLPLAVFLSKMQQFVTHVNSIFTPFTSYLFDLNWDRIKQHRIYFVIRKDEYVLEPERLSGYESIVLLLSINYALLHVNEEPHSTMLWIDESFDCLDEDRFATDLPKLMEHLKELYTTVVLISFRDIPFSIINHRIRIQIQENASYLS